MFKKLLILPLTAVILVFAGCEAQKNNAAIESAIDTATDLRSQFSQLSGTLSDINFSLESAHFAKKQMMESKFLET